MYTNIEIELKCNKDPNIDEYNKYTFWFNELKLILDGYTKYKKEGNQRKYRPIKWWGRLSRENTITKEEVIQELKDTDYFYILKKLVLEEVHSKITYELSEE